MSLQAGTGRASAGFGSLVRLLIVIAAPLTGFLAASSFEHCGPRLLSMALGVGLVAPAAGNVAARIMRLDAFGTLVFIILAMAFVLVAGPMMDQCRPGF
jgi:predicted membrane channel-forming protein YqfA (hemolysin III family)